MRNKFESDTAQEYDKKKNIMKKQRLLAMGFNSVISIILIIISIYFGLMTVDLKDAEQQHKLLVETQLVLTVLNIIVDFIIAF